MYKFTLIKVISRCIPEGGVKNFIRRSILKIKSNIPREFMINRNDIVLQVGTPNIKTLYRLRKNVGGTGKVIIIEADITNVNNLENYCKTSGFKNVIIINIAAGDYTGTAKFLLGQNPGDNRLVIDDIVHDNDLISNSYKDCIDIKVDTVDNILFRNTIKKLDYVEIAVNGAEIAVLKGMPHFLKNTNRIFVKGHARYKLNNKPINQDIELILKRAGFYTFLTRPTDSRSESEWGKREGDVYGFRL